MSDQVVSTLLAIITTIIGGVFGFVMSEVSTTRREKREKAERAEAVRLILGLELDRNLTTLREQWAAVHNKDDGSGDMTDSRRRQFASTFLDVPLLPFSRDSLNSQLGLLPGALPYITIRKVFSAYDAFGKVETLRKDLHASRLDQQAEWARFQASQSAPGQPPGLVYAPRRSFDAKAEQVWDEIESLVKSTLEAGNPLA